MSKCTQDFGNTLDYEHKRIIEFKLPRAKQNVFGVGQLGVKGKGLGVLFRVMQN